RFGQTMVMHHAMDRQVLNRYDAVGVHDLTRLLVSKVLPSIGDPLMDMGHHFASFLSGRSPLRLPGQTPLCLRQPWLFGTEEARVLNVQPITGHGEAVQAN